MDRLSPDTSENVLITLSQVVIGGKSYRGIITVSHLVLNDMESGNRVGSIPFDHIELATGSFNRLHEPVILLSVQATEGGLQEIELIFPHIAGGAHIRSRDATLSVLKAQNVPVTVDQQAMQAAYRHSRGKESMDAGTGMFNESPTDRTTVQDWTRFGIPHSTGSTLLPEEDARPTSPLVTIVVAILLAALCITAMVMPLGPREDVANLSQPARVSPTSLPVTTATPGVTPAGPGIPSVQGSVPGNGIFATISCPGNYSGYFSAEGWRMDVKSAGTQIFALPVQDTTINAAIRKTEDTYDRLEVAVYNGGVALAYQETTTPRGLVEMQVPVGQAGSGSSQPLAASPMTATTGPVIYTVPATGVWVHVAYPGNYTGSITANGLRKQIDASGDQIYQMVMKTGAIDGVLEKSDGSVEPLEIEVYRDGVLIDLANTTTPRGTAEIHTTL